MEGVCVGSFVVLSHSEGIVERVDITPKVNKHDKTRGIVVVISLGCLYFLANSPVNNSIQKIKPHIIIKKANIRAIILFYITLGCVLTTIHMIRPLVKGINEYAYRFTFTRNYFKS